MPAPLTPLESPSAAGWALSFAGVLALAYLATGGGALLTGGPVPFGEAGIAFALYVLALRLSLLLGILRRVDEVPLLRLGASGLRLLDRYGNRAVAAMALAFALTVGAASFHRYETFEAGAFDLGIFHQAVWATAHGKLLFSSLKDDIVLLGDHFSPILAALAPLCLWGSDPRLLLAVQTLALASAAFPLYRLAHRELQGGATAALVPGAFLMSAPLRNLGLCDFHPETLAVPLLLWACVFLVERRRGPFLAACLAAATCKETTLLAVVGMGLMVALSTEWRKTGLLLALTAAGLFWVEISVLLPHFAGRQTPYLDRYAQLGASFGEVLAAPLLRPFVLLKLLVWPPLKIEWMSRLLLPLALLPLFAPSRLLAVLPLFAMNVFAGYGAMQSVHFQYHAEMMPLLAFAAVGGVQRLVRYTPRWFSSLGREMSERRRNLGVVLAACALFMVGQPELVRFAQTPRTDRMRRIDRELALIPDGASVSGQNQLLPHLASRFGLYHFPKRLSESQYVVLDHSLVEPRWHASPQEIAASEASLPGLGFKLLLDDDGFRIYGR